MKSSQKISALPLAVVAEDVAADAGDAEVDEAARTIARNDRNDQKWKATELPKPLFRPASRRGFYGTANPWRRV